MIGFRRTLLDADGNPQKETVVTTIPGVSLNMIPVVETDYSTACLTHIPQANPEDTYNGVMLFPKGPGCNEDDTNRRLEVGTYNLSIHHGTLYKNVLKFSRLKPSGGGRALEGSQARLIHKGVDFGNSTGCGLPGSRYILKQEIVIPKDKHKDKQGNYHIKAGQYTDTVLPDWNDSIKEEKKLKEKVVSFGVDKKGNCSLQAVMAKSFDEVKKASEEEQKEN
ncbi:hypothetical protein Aasi_0513 [Candidatus Amoebophilus asiaticus 5a2]|uniref:DUF5675 domain-containing protein n=1 Tax=Amoebophilus asiaticus (strain 5a2) TaxID=452471 RepID=B3ERR5_AMOA5|nr:hypothetical protein [Candidatus Amoebophilus asiaticus]ACE05917.1 hypothetical protein Aasi_0513 [Candidatus Amoebophilus asiaticus 5a2]